MLRHFCLFFKLCSWCFQQSSGNSVTRAPQAYPEFSITIYIGERMFVCFVQGDTKKAVITKNRITSKILFRLTQNFSYIR